MHCLRVNLNLVRRPFPPLRSPSKY